MKKLICLTSMTLASTQADVHESEKYGGIYKAVMRVSPATPIGNPAEAARHATGIGANSYDPLVRVFFARPIVIVGTLIILMVIICEMVPS